MRDSFVPRRGAVLMKTPTHRQRMIQRRLALVGGLLAFAVLSGLVGALIHPRGEALGRLHTGPYSYFPAQ